MPGRRFLKGRCPPAPGCPEVPATGDGGDESFGVQAGRARFAEYSLPQFSFERGRNRLAAAKKLVRPRIVERHRSAIEDAGKILRDMKPDRTGSSGEKNRPAELVEPFCLLLAALGFQGSAPGAIRKMVATSAVR